MITLQIIMSHLRMDWFFQYLLCIIIHKSFFFNKFSFWYFFQFCQRKLKISSFIRNFRWKVKSWNQKKIMIKNCNIRSGQVNLLNCVTKFPPVFFYIRTSDIFPSKSNCFFCLCMNNISPCLNLHSPAIWGIIIFSLLIR